jgi:hypothetical protein
MCNLGDFELIYPPKKPSLNLYYKSLIDQATLNWEELTTGRKRNPPTKFVTATPPNLRKSSIINQE